MKNKKNILVTIAFIVFSCLMLILTIRGFKGNPRIEQLNTASWKEEGPFELSPERGRFALTYSIAEDKSLSFSENVARFALPDLGYHGGKYVSLFAPAVSFLTAPGYILGKYLGYSQLGTTAVIGLFAILNIIVIRAISKKLGTPEIPSILAGFIFLFATPAFSYAGSIYQHHISTFLFLASIYVYLKYSAGKTILLNSLLYGIGMSVDYPNAIMMLPSMIFSLGKAINKAKDKTHTTYTVSLGKLFAMSGIVFPLIFFFWFNYTSYGSPIKLAGTVQHLEEITPKGEPVLKGSEDILASDIEDRKSDSPLGFFDSRNLLNGLYTLLLSLDRGTLVYTPIIVVGFFFALKFIRRSKNKAAVMMFFVVCVNLIIYSMWGDPWGGWAFGSRYLIPSYAILSIFIGLTLSELVHLKGWQVAAFYVICAYSISVNSLGAVTSNSNPPSIEVESLSESSGKTEKFSYDRNLDRLNSGKSKSFVFQEILKGEVSAWQYFLLVNSLLIFFFSSTFVLHYIFHRGLELNVNFVANTFRRLHLTAANKKIL